MQSNDNRAIRFEHQNSIASILAVFSKCPDIDQAILYGSRAKGNYHHGSDIDITLTGNKLTINTLFNIATNLDDLLLPYKIDLSLYDDIDNTGLLEHIKRVGIIIYTK